MQPRLFAVFALLLVSILPLRAMAQSYHPYSYRGKFAIGFTAESLTRFVPETVTLAAVGKYHANDNLAFQGKFGMCPFLPATVCAGADMVLQSLVFEDDKLDLNVTFGVGVTAGFILAEDTPVDTAPPQLVYGTASVGISVQSKQHPVDFTADIGPSSMHAGTYAGVSTRITFAVRHYF